MLDDAVLGRWAWRGWRFAWDAEPGAHEVCCRARDAAGNEQPPEPPWNLGGYGNNAVQGMSDNGITLSAANNSLVKDNDVRQNAGGIELGNASSGNRIENNNACDTTGIGIEVGLDGNSNVVIGNTSIIVTLPPAA